jgi:modulator of FtsH protease
MNDWSNFFIAMAGAAAALAGLIFVSVSINLAKILSIPSLPDRALESLILLINILIVSALALVPGQSVAMMGIEFLVLGAIVWALMLYLDLRIWRMTNPGYQKHSRQNIVFSQLAISPYMLAGILMIWQGSIGLYWIIPGVIISFIKAITDAWVMLVEINR